MTFEIENDVPIPARTRVTKAGLFAASLVDALTKLGMGQSFLVPESDAKDSLIAKAVTKARKATGNEYHVHRYTQATRWRVEKKGE